MQSKTTSTYKENKVCAMTKKKKKNRKTTTNQHSKPRCDPVRVLQREQKDTRFIPVLAQLF